MAVPSLRRLESPPRPRHDLESTLLQSPLQSHDDVQCDPGGRSRWLAWAGAPPALTIGAIRPSRTALERTFSALPTFLIFTSETFLTTCLPAASFSFRSPSRPY